MCSFIALKWQINTKADTDRQIEDKYTQIFGWISYTAFVLHYVSYIVSIVHFSLFLSASFSISIYLSLFPFFCLKNSILKSTLTILLTCVYSIFLLTCVYVVCTVYGVQPHNELVSNTIWVVIIRVIEWGCTIKMDIYIYIFTLSNASNQMRVFIYFSYKMYCCCYCTSIIYVFVWLCVCVCVCVLFLNECSSYSAIITHAHT